MPIGLILTCVTKINVLPVVTRTIRPEGGRLFSYQSIVFEFHDGNTQELIVHLETGLHALAVGDVVTNDKASE